MSNWTDSIIGERMTVDQQFSDRIQASQFTNSEWGLIMTATELEIENADDPETATIVANTDNLATIIPELDEIRSQTAAMAGQPSSGSESSGGGLLGSLKRALGFSGNDDSGVDQEKLAAAESLTQEYAETLQQHLVSNGTFERARQAYLDSQQSSSQQSS
jgi:hypothetical protein